MGTLYLVLTSRGSIKRWGIWWEIRPSVSVGTWKAGKRYILRLCLVFTPWGVYGKGDEVNCADLCYTETR